MLSILFYISLIYSLSSSLSRSLNVSHQETILRTSAYPLDNSSLRMPRESCIRMSQSGSPLRILCRDNPSASWESISFMVGWIRAACSNIVTGCFKHLIPWLPFTSRSHSCSTPWTGSAAQSSLHPESFPSKRSAVTQVFPPSIDTSTRTIPGRCAWVQCKCGAFQSLNSILVLGWFTFCLLPAMSLLFVNRFATCFYLISSVAFSPWSFPI